LPTLIIICKWHIKIEKVQEIIAENKLNKTSSLEDYAVEVIQETEKDNNYGQESLTRFDQLKKKKNKQKTKVSSGK
jgi:hypothetical protein